MSNPIATHFSWDKWIWPILIGFAASATVMWIGFHQIVEDPDSGQSLSAWDLLTSFQWTPRASKALGAIGACILLRDLGYIIRLHILSFGKLNWRQCFENIMLWELASALTPSVVGGSAAAVFILKRDGLKWGSSLATVFATALMDETFYLLAVPVMFGLALLTSHPIFPATTIGELSLDQGIPAMFGIAYAAITVICLILLWGLVLRPFRANQAISWASNLRVLRRWKPSIQRWASDLLVASQSIRSASVPFWIKAFSATCVSWSARFFTLNMILIIFYDAVPHAAVMARQLVLWLVMTISPTPGSAGVAELGLPAVLGDIMGLAYLAVVVVIWRFATYFLYLFLGALVLPGWLIRTQKAKNRVRLSHTS